MADAARRAGHVLLAEDHPVNQRVATAMLESFDVDVDVVANGEEAVKAATATPYRTIFMDCHLPVLDGYEATSEIRRVEGTTRRTPIIAVTASAQSDEPRCRAAGMDDFLTKPLSLRTLAAVLARWAPQGPDTTIAAAREAAAAATPFGPAGEAEPTRPALDAHVVARLESLGRAAGEDLIGQLTPLFLGDADSQVGALRQALAWDDAAAVFRSAHTLSGASANLGATDLARLCATLATTGAAGDLEGAKALLFAIEGELRRVRCALGAHVPTP